MRKVESLLACLPGLSMEEGAETSEQRSRNVIQYLRNTKRVAYCWLKFQSSDGKG